MKQRYEKMKAERPDLFRDILEYTKLPEATVETLSKREILTYIEEWNTRKIPDEHYFYLTSRACFWGNTVTIEVDHYPDVLARYVKPGSTVLDYAGGIGTLAFRLADSGYKVEYTELSVLEKDFTRFRNFQRENKIKIMDIWEPFQPSHYDAIFAIDVFEHISEGAALVRDRLIPSLKPNGILIDVSFFQTTNVHPMHLPPEYETKLVDEMNRQGMAVIFKECDTRIWQKSEKA